jgi:acetyl-CoA carboxylase biotin carboxyl carrier protein
MDCNHHAPRGEVFCRKELLVADESPKSTNPGPFDVRTVKNLVALMASHDLAEIDLRDGMQRVRIRRGSHKTVMTTVPALPATPASAVAAAPPPAAKPSTDAPAPKSGKKLLEIKSESVGTFYSKPSPEAAPYVTIGSKVTPTTVVCTLEAMKLFSEVQAGVAGTILEICVENQSPVEFGQVLFRVEA